MLIWGAHLEIVVIVQIFCSIATHIWRIVYTVALSVDFIGEHKQGIAKFLQSWRTAVFPDKYCFNRDINNTLDI